MEFQQRTPVQLEAHGSPRPQFLNLWTGSFKLSFIARKALTESTNYQTIKNKKSNENPFEVFEILNRREGEINNLRRDWWYRLEQKQRTRNRGGTEEGDERHVTNTYWEKKKKWPKTRIDRERERKRVKRERTWSGCRDSETERREMVRRQSKRKVVGVLLKALKKSVMKRTFSYVWPYQTVEESVEASSIVSLSPPPLLSHLLCFRQNRMFLFFFIFFIMIAFCDLSLTFVFFKFE